jgi:predicted oxidoreductase
MQMFFKKKKSAQEAINDSISELEYALNNNKSKETKLVYIRNAKRYLEEAELSLKK